LFPQLPDFITQFVEFSRFVAQFFNLADLSAQAVQLCVLSGQPLDFVDRPGQLRMGGLEFRKRLTLREDAAHRPDKAEQTNDG
jgi:hypothetical protein